MADGSGYVTVDIEIAKPLPEDEKDWKTHRPLGISCAATLTEAGDLTLWHGGSGDLAVERYPDQMSSIKVQGLILYLQWHVQNQGRFILTWNGLGFDFDILAEESESEYLAAQCRTLALDHHIDPGFAMLCAKGYMVGLDTAAKGMGLEGKIEGMKGDLAPVMWARGLEEQKKVLEYVAQDVRTTAEVYEAMINEGRLSWISRSGRANVWRLPNRRVLTVREALDTPEPDTSWMTSPWPRSKFYGWTGWEGRRRR